MKVLTSQHTLRLLETDPQSAVTWVNDIPDGAIRDQALNNMACQWWKLDPSQLTNGLKLFRKPNNRELEKS